MRRTVKHSAAENRKQESDGTRRDVEQLMSRISPDFSSFCLGVVFLDLEERLMVQTDTVVIDCK
eukprot:m.882904 g.882904  ORF g.882904 m.882904 type:complete len:64 (-) comp23599_c0_seq1:308-499(-)